MADTRIHGTTKRQVGKVFCEVERAALRSLPSERFSFFHEARRKVNRDGHVEVAKAYYSAPTEYLGREVWARWDARLVHLFNHRWEKIAVHVRHDQGRFSTHAGHNGARPSSSDALKVSTQLRTVGRKSWPKDKRATAAEVVACRIDFADWLKLLSRCERRIALNLASGEKTSAVAEKFGVTSARISQLRAWLRDSWQRFQGEAETMQGQLATA